MGRVRIFAGPNGSGKSTIIQQFAYNLGHYLNADDILRQIASQKIPFLELTNYGVASSTNHFLTFIESHGLYSKLKIHTTKRAEELHNAQIVQGILLFSTHPGNMEIAIVTDFLRTQLLQNTQTFSFETVFSHPGKISFIEDANRAGFRTYLYFVSTESVEINIERVHQRGHSLSRKNSNNYFGRKPTSMV